MPDERPLTADEVARRQFATAFRGFEQNEVRAFLAQVAAELASLGERERSLRERLATLEARPAPVALSVDDEAMEAALGAETTRVIHAAREAAAEIRQRAEESVARMLREANAEASRLRHEAENVLAARSEEAEAAAAAIRAEARAAADELRTTSEAQAADAVAEAQQLGKEMVAEAQAVRQRMLSDLARRRAKAATQLEQLRAGRERLLAAYDVVRTTLEQATNELTVADAEAKLAAEAASLRAPDLEHLDLPEPEVELPDPAVDEAPVPEPAAMPVEAAPEPESPASVPQPEPEPERVPEPAAAPTLSIVPAPEAEADDGPAVRVRPVPLARPVDPAPAGEERRSSALRLLRRKAEAAGEAPPLEEELEGVRIIRPAPAPAAASEPAPAAHTEPHPISRPRTEPEVEPEVAVVEPHVVVADAPEPEPEHEVAVDDDVEHEAKPVDDLFARLRADRAKSVEQAEAVLATVEEPASAPEPEPEPEPATADAVFEARDAAIEAAERALTRSLKRALADEQNEVLDALRRLKGRPSVEALLASPDDQAVRYRSASAPHLAAGVEAAGGAIDVDVFAAAFAAEVAADLRARVSRAVDDAGSDTEQLQDALNAAYREWKSSRAEPVGRHAVAAAYATAQYAAAPDGSLVWAVDKAEGGCPDCDDNALAGPTPKGEPFPTGQLHPPAHAGCRCLVLPPPK